MRYDDLTRKWGTQTEIARALNTHQSTVSEWKKNGIPWVWQLQIAALTGDELKADLRHARQKERKKYRAFIQRDAAA